MSRNLLYVPPPPAAGPEREEGVAVIAFGSNLGDREGTIRTAAELISRLPMVTDLELSEVFETVALRPYGPDSEAPAYLNAVAIIRTRLDPQILLGMLHAIEVDHGRERHEQWGDRTLDLDLISYGDLVLNSDNLTLPHPRAVERLFVLEPWLSVDPDAVLPGEGRVSALVSRLRDPEEQ